MTYFVNNNLLFFSTVGYGIILVKEDDIMPTKLAKISAYVDQELYQELKELAEANERTVSKQIVYILKQYLKNEK